MDGKTFLKSMLHSIPYIKVAYKLLTIGFERKTIRNFEEPITLFTPSRGLHFSDVMDRKGRFEAPMAKKFLESLNSNSMVLDIGASVGVYALIAGRKTENIHCFEPEPYFVYLMKKNIRHANISATIVQKFVGDKDSSKMVTIDTYCQRKKICPTHIKADIEGYEVYALRSMKETLTRCKPKLFIEFHERIIKERLGFNEEDVNNFFSTLRKCGYDIVFNGHHYEMRTSKSGFYDFKWHAIPPNNVVYALFAQLPSKERRSLPEVN